jgi:dTDP-4-amino-4,6-dideoxygalactose transaminase
MAAILINIQKGDEVIIPSFTFVSTANAFILRGAKIVFADSNKNNPNIDVYQIEKLITDKTKAIVPVHYAGISCDMDKIMEIANKYNLYVIEDAAQSIDAFYKQKPLGSIGHLSVFSFHETKNIISGEGGMLVINDERFIKRAEIIWEKGTNRTSFRPSDINKYDWIDIGSSFLPSELVAAFLYAQLENIDKIQTKRKKLWNYYYFHLKALEAEKLIKLPYIPDYATNNAHIFYIILENTNIRNNLISHFNNNNILAFFHYFSLHKSPFFKEKHDGRELPNADFYSNTLLRLPLYYDLTQAEQDKIISLLKNYFKK